MSVNFQHCVLPFRMGQNGSRGMMLYTWSECIPTVLCIPFDFFHFPYNITRSFVCVLGYFVNVAIKRQTEIIWLFVLTERDHFDSLIRGRKEKTSFLIRFRQPWIEWVVGFRVTHAMYLFSCSCGNNHTLTEQIKVYHENHGWYNECSRIDAWHVRSVVVGKSFQQHRINLLEQSPGGEPGFDITYSLALFCTNQPSKQY